MTDAFTRFNLAALRRQPHLACYFRYPLHHGDFWELRDHGRLLGRLAAKPLYGRLTRAGMVDRSAGFNGHIAIIFIPARARTARAAQLFFAQMPPERVTLPNGRRHWPAIRAAAEEAVRSELRRRRERRISMHASQSILLAVDDSEATARTVAYVASILAGQPGFHLCLVHVSASLPPRLLEFGGAEDPAEEERQERDRRDEQLQWLARAKASAWHMFAHAQAILQTAGIPASAVTTDLVTSLSGEDLVTNLLEAARTLQCGTVVVGRDSFSWLKERFHRHVGEDLVCRGQGFAIWVVE